MATLLYKIGRFCSRRHWLVIALWLLALGTAIGVGTAVKTPVTSEFDLPGTRFQVVLEELREKLPEASGGMGTVVFEAKDGHFDDNERAAVTAAVEKWNGHDAVRDAMDPFATQAQIDGAEAQTSAGAEKLAAGKKQLDAAKKELDAGRKELDDNRKKLDDGKKQLEQGQQRLAGLQQQLAAAEKKGDRQAAAAAKTQIGMVETRVTQGRAQLQAGEQAWAAGDKEWREDYAKWQAGQVESDKVRAELKLGKRQAALTKGMRFVNEDKGVAITQIRFVNDIQSVSQDDKDFVMAAKDDLDKAGVNAYFSQEISSDFNSIMGATELIGLAVAALVLFLMLGRLVIAGLPLVMAGVGVGVGMGVTWILSQVWEMQHITPALATMIGLAVGIDYSLFIVNRHRTQLLENHELHDSAGRATGTAGNAVVFAGATVIIALAALAVTWIPFLAVMGLMAAITVALAVLVAITLTPAILGLLGHRAVPKKLWRRYGFTDTGEPIEGRDHMSEEAEEAVRAGKSGWGERVTRRPWLTLLIGMALAAAVAYPALSLRLGLPDGGSEPPDSGAYKAYTLTKDNFGPGMAGPIIAVAELPEGLDGAAAKQKQMDVADQIAKVEGIEYVAPIGLAEDRRTTAFQAVPTTGPADEATVELVDHLREALPGMQQTTGASVDITGHTVANIDISAKLADALPPYLLIVVGLSLLILLVVFRSLIVPLLATGGFLISLAVAFGGVVAVYQWGHLGPLFSVHNPSPVLSFLPIILIGVLFGLAMDYQMFLVTGMREAHSHGEEARKAVLTGYHHGARVVTAAAIIMISVFAGFIWSELTMIRPIGFALALGVFVDAFLVRMTLTPAAMHLLGERAWWLPKWLDRLIPDVDVEGVKLVEMLDHADGHPGAAPGARERAGSTAVRRTRMDRHKGWGGRGGRHTIGG